MDDVNGALARLLVVVAILRGWASRIQELALKDWPLAFEHRRDSSARSAQCQGVLASM
jgi:hypothetical protein